MREAVRADLPVDERRWLLLDADVVLGLDLHRTWDAGADTEQVEDPRVDALLDEREAARAAHDYGRADAIRRELVAMGVEVRDR